MCAKETDISNPLHACVRASAETCIIILRFDQSEKEVLDVSPAGFPWSLHIIRLACLVFRFLSPLPSFIQRIPRKMEPKAGQATQGKAKSCLVLSCLVWRPLKENKSIWTGRTVSSRRREPTSVAHTSSRAGNRLGSGCGRGTDRGSTGEKRSWGR